MIEAHELTKRYGDTTAVHSLSFSVKDLIAAIEAFIDGWNERCQLFVWTKTPGEILTPARDRQRSSFTRH